jgi:hypothetical protein
MKDLFQVFWIGKIEVLLQEEAQAISKSPNKKSKLKTTLWKNYKPMKVCTAATAIISGF